jgi:hypothetical protein
MKPLSRRSVTTGLAAAVTAIPALGLCKGAEGPSELAAIVRRYFAELDEFDSMPGHVFDALPDAEVHAIANATYAGTAKKMIGVPARTPADALAAVDWIIREGRDSVIEIDGKPDAFLYNRVTHSLIHALRDYLAGRVA